MTGLDRVGEITARLNAATPGPWENLGDTGPYVQWILGRAKSPDEGYHGTQDVLLVDSDYISSGLTDDDAEFIAAAPADIAFLLARITELETGRDKVLELHKPREYTEFWTNMPTGMFYCARCIHEGVYPCATVRALTPKGEPENE